jgi:hypothetical protein
MLSPATFIGIANATAPAGKPGPSAAPAVNPSNIQKARVPPTPPAALPVTPQPPKPGTTASPSHPATPPRNLPRGSLLDLSV